MEVINGKTNRDLAIHIIETKTAKSTTDTLVQILMLKRGLRKFLRNSLGRRIKGMKNNRGGTSNRDESKASKLGRK